MTMDTIKAIQKEIIAKLEAGEDVSELTEQLAQERAKIAARTEVAELQKVADERQALRDRAKVVKARVEAQGLGIDRFLELRDSLVKKLHPLLEPMNELAKMGAAAWEREPGTCYSGFGDMAQFAGAVKQVPKGYLPADFGCPFLEMADGTQSARDKAREASIYFQWAYSILTSFQKGISTLPPQPAEGLVAIDEPEPGAEFEAEPEAGSCIVCSHAEVEAINSLLGRGKPLRDIESEFGVSRSSLSRHKQHIAAPVSQEG